MPFVGNGNVDKYSREAHISCTSYRASRIVIRLTAYDSPLQVENECGEIPTILVQNKMDLIEQCVIDP